MNEKLIRAAREARKNAHAPYSQFQVGAAVLSKEGRIFSGCNVENRTYGLTLCAERVAIFKAISEGCKQLIEVCIVADADQLTPPCGACRQIIWEFCGDIPILMANLKGEVKTVRCSQLLPLPFGLEKGRRRAKN